MSSSHLHAEGMIFIHSAPTALRDHIEWMVNAAVVAPMWQWRPQPVCPGSWRAEVAWSGDMQQVVGLVSTLCAWRKLRFEVTVESGAPTQRWSYTPDLGVFHCATDDAGSIRVDEVRLRTAVMESRRMGTGLATQISGLLAETGDGELEEYRACDPTIDVSWFAAQVG